MVFSLIKISPKKVQRNILKESMPPNIGC